MFYFFFSKPSMFFDVGGMFYFLQWTVPFVQFKVFPCQRTVTCIWLCLSCQHTKLVPQQWEGADGLLTSSWCLQAVSAAQKEWSDLPLMPSNKYFSAMVFPLAVSWLFTWSLLKLQESVIIADCLSVLKLSLLPSVRDVASSEKLI